MDFAGLTDSRKLLLRREHGQGTQELFPFERELRDFVRAGRLAGANFGRVERVAGVARPFEIDHGVARHPEYPRAERQAALLVAGQRFDHLDEDPLDEILGIGSVPDAEQGKPVDPRREFLVERPKGVRVAPNGAFHQRVDVGMVGHGNEPGPPLLCLCCRRDSGSHLAAEAI